MVALGQTIEVIDKSGKVVSTSKHLFGVFKEARSAYRDRKAAINAEGRAKQAEKEARRAIAAYHIDDGRHSTTSSRKHPGRSKSVYYQHDDQRSSTHSHRSHGRSHRRRSYEKDPEPRGLTRRHTSHNVAAMYPNQLYPGTRSHSAPHVDMDLAYGEFHPSSLERANPSPDDEEKDLPGLVGKVKGLLKEADCAQHSVTAMVSHLQNHPDAMAAVALTLAEISNLAQKLGPAALTTLRTSAPAVFALLASPQFMIAAGVGIGVTVVMFGGYKIVKQIQSAKANNADGGNQQSVDEMMEFNPPPAIHGIENWRRGVADSEAESVATSVDGEFITPTAAAMSGIWRPDHDRVSQLRGERPRGVPRSRAPGSSASSSAYTHSSRGSETSSSYTRQSKSSRSSKRSAKDKEAKEKKEKKEKKKKDKKKKPSPLRLLFK